LDGDVWERLLADVRGHIWDHGDFSKLAATADVSVSTVSKLAHADTGSPHMRTVIRIMDALGKSDPILEAFESKNPVSISQARKRKSARARNKERLAAKVKPHQIKKAVRVSVQRTETRH
jgi:hypothetical protein